jgi:hypothetical protein
MYCNRFKLATVDDNGMYYDHFELAATGKEKCRGQP